jgi:signal peptidase I
MIPTPSKSYAAHTAVLTFITLIFAWHFFAPIQLGGKASYAFIVGPSMQPNFQSGDLAITRAQTAYHPGDVVIYVSPKKRWVIHRIASVCADGGYLMRGDNNGWYDLSCVAQEDIVGKLWYHIPSVMPPGDNILATQRNLALTAATAGLYILR